MITQIKMKDFMLCVGDKRMGEISQISHSKLIQKKITCFSITKGHLSKVPVVVSLHFQIKYFGLGIAGFGNQKFV